MVLPTWLLKDVQGVGILPETQAGHRAGESTIDNIYILQHVLDRELEKVHKERKSKVRGEEGICEGFWINRG